VKILFDANTPAPLARFLKGHQISFAREFGWQGLENGELLRAAEEARFDVLLTCDRNVEHQQNLAKRTISLVILSTNHWPSMRPVATRIATAVDFVQRGQVVRVEVAALYT
jgi:predicted nuclease of predicted toxin-antitoxin system